MGWGLLGSSSREWLFPQNDPDKEYNMPKDGTVHELTSNVGAAQAPGVGATRTSQCSAPSADPAFPRSPNPKWDPSLQPPFHSADPGP